MNYYLTVIRNKSVVVSRLRFDDYSDAVQYLTRYYQPRMPGVRSTLELTTEVINGSFARSYGTLFSPQECGHTVTEEMMGIAAKQKVSFIFDGHYRFLIESEVGASEADANGSED
jgi:hypothetical protein